MRPTISDYLDLLLCRGELGGYGEAFTPDQGLNIFRTCRCEVRVTDAQGPAMTVAATTADRARLITWEVHVHGAPLEVLDAVIRAADPTLPARS